MTTRATKKLSILVITPLSHVAMGYYCAAVQRSPFQQKFPQNVEWEPKPFFI